MLNNFHIYRIHLLVTCFLLGCFFQLKSQNKSTRNDDIWQELESSLDRLEEESPTQFLLDHVSEKCGASIECQIDFLEFLVNKMERRFDLLTAINLAIELERLTSQEGQTLREARTSKDLYRFYDALGEKAAAIKYIDKSIKLFDQVGQKDELLVAQLVKLETNINEDNLKEMLPRIIQLYDSAYARSYTHIFTALLQRIIERSMEAQLYEQAERYVQEMEKIPISSPPKAGEYGTAILSKLGRADLAVVRGKLDEARKYYFDALRLCEEEPSRWLEIYVLQSLSKIFWQSNRKSKAEEYILRALDKAEALNLDDLLAMTYQIMAAFAEEETNYKDALEFTRKMDFHQKKFDQRGASFNLKSYFLELEKNQLATEKENKELELRLKDSQLLATAIVTGLLAIIAIILIFAIVHSERRKNTLAERNSLISKQAQQLKELDIAKNRFFANVSHELRTPLGLILGPISSLLNDPTTDKKKLGLLEMARNSIYQLQNLVNEILDLGKLDMGKMEIQDELTAIDMFFKGFATQFESLALQKQIRYTYNSTVSPEIHSYLDKEKFRQIFSNLLSNAFKFTPDGGSITADLSLEKGNLYFSVQDSGSGIHADDLPRLFERYFQTLHPEKSVQGGSGIGLTLSQEYAQLLGGKIVVESELGKGAKFTLKVPIVTQKGQASELERIEMYIHPSRAKSLATIPVPIEGSKPLILLVEDNVDFQYYIREILSDSYDLIIASNGKIALEQLQNLPSCDLIISDLMMPIMNGFEFLQELKQTPSFRSIPVLMMTARAEKRDRLHALRIGVDDYLLKPFEEEEFLVRIDNMLTNQASRKEEWAKMEQTKGSQENEPDDSEDQEWLKEFESYILKHISVKNLSIPQLADEFAMSESSLLRQVKRLTGLSPLQYLKEVRLQEGRRLLEHQAFSSVAKIAEKVGYQEIRSFSRAFKGRFGKNPSAVLKNH